MPRKLRIVEDSGYYHVIVRGNGRQMLFEDDGDYTFYLQSLEKSVKATEKAEIHAYCLMNNHVHLLVSAWGTGLPELMQKLGTRYASYYNWKYEHVGHVFQGRYKSELILDTRYLVSVLKYIINNPVKAGLGSAALYPWSSYDAYGRTDTFVKTDVFLPLIGDAADFERFILSDDPVGADEPEWLEVKEEDPDRYALKLMKDLLGIDHAADLQEWPKTKRNAALRLLLEKGVSARRLERLCGISRKIIARM